MTLRTIVVDDSLIFRKVVRDALSEFEEVEVIDIARDGLTALEKITLQKPDLVTLDVEMPGLNGIEVLRELENRGIKTRVIMVSSQTKRGAEVTTQALSMGAFDFILKPEGSNFDESLNMLRRELEKRIAVLLPKKTTSRIAAKPASNHVAPKLSTSSQTNVKTRIDANDLSTTKFPSMCKAIFIGISTGGPKALANVIPKIPAGFPFPIVIVQHMPPLFTATMAESLNGNSKLNVAEAADGMCMVAGGVYIAPGGKQLGVSTNVRGDLVACVSNSAPIKSCKPSVDHMLGSIPRGVARRSLAIIMTGMGDDGRDGCTTLRAQGATVWAQSESTCTVYGMPRQIVENGLADSVFDLDALPGLLGQLVRKQGLGMTTTPGKPLVTSSQSITTNSLNA